jgi:hypothetical protein
VPFLWLNGIGVEVLEGGNRIKEDAGRVSRGITGQQTRDRRFIRRRWEFKTTLMPYDEYTQLLGICATGGFYTWRWENNTNTNWPTNHIDTTYSSSASNITYASALAADGTPAVAQAKFGSYALSLAGIGQNYWGDNVARGTDTSSATAGFTAVGAGAIASSTTRAWEGARSLRVITTGAGDGFRTDGITGIVGYRFTASIWVTGDDAKPLTMQLISGGVDLGTRTITPIPGSWKRFWIVSTVNAPATPTDTHLKVTQQDTGTATYYVDGLMLARGNSQGASPYLSPWHTGSRSQATFNIRHTGGLLLGGKLGVTASCWIKKPQIPGGIALNLMRYEAGTPYGPRLFLGCQNQAGNTLYQTGFAFAMTTCKPDGTYTTITPALTDADWVDDYTFHMVTGVVNPYMQSGNPSMAFYFDGALRAQSTVDMSTFDASQITMFNPGCNINGDTPYGAPIDDHLIVTYPLSADAVADLYSSQGAAIQLPRPFVQAEGEVMGNAPVRVIAKTEKAEFLPYKDSRTGSFRNNGVRASLILTEA